MIKNFKFSSLVVALVLCLAGATFSQETTGNIEGTITDAQGARVPGATVVLTGPGVNRTVTTDEEGFFRALQVKPGSYIVEVTATNFRPARREGLEVTLGQSTMADIKLEAGGVTETVTISGSEETAVDVTDSKIQTSFTAREIELLPKGTNFTSIINQAAGVRNEPLSAGFSFDGASGAENTFIIDGQEVTNFRTGQLNSTNNIPFEFVQELQLKTNGFEAEYGGATGGVVNVVTKSGTNEYHGTLGVQFERDALSANPRTILGAATNTLSYINPNGGRFTANNFNATYPSASIGGPILKDRLWFFASVAPQFQNTERSYTFPNGTAQNFRQEDRRDYANIKLDAAIHSKVNLSSSFVYNPLRREGNIADVFSLDSATTPTDIGEGVGGFSFDGLGGRVNSNIFNVSGLYTPTSNIVLAARFGRTFLNEKIGAYGVPNVVRFRTLTSGLPGFPAGFSSVPTNFQNNFDVSIRRTFDVDGSFLVNNLIGRHQFKGGFQYNGLSNNVDQGYFGTGEIRLFPGRTFAGIGGSTGELGYGYLQRFSTLGQASSASKSLYIQDSWQPTSRLTLNLGLRIEKEDVPTFSATGDKIVFGWGDKPAPRLGFAYDLTGNGNSKIFASYGWFYDRFKYELPRGSFGGDLFLRDYFPITNASPFFYTRERVIGAGGLSQLQIDFRVPSNDPSDNRIDPDLKAARQSEFTVGYEQQLTRTLTFSTRYTHKQVDEAIEDVGIFDAGGNELYFIANPGRGVVGEPLLAGVPATPDAERKYDALEVRLDKRFGGGSYLGGNYTYSRLFGNYSGLASSDERGRSSPNVNRFFDLPYLGFDLNGRPDNGRLATDRPHVLKLNGAYTFNYQNVFGNDLSMGGRMNTTFSAFTTVQSGTPLSTRIQFYSADTFLFERGDLGRTETFTQTDINFSHKIRVGSGENKQIAFDFNIDNLFNENNVLDLFTNIAPVNLTAGSFSLPGFTLNGSETEAIQAVFNGGLTARAVDLINRGNSGASTCGSLGTASCAQFRQDARYLSPQTFQVPRFVRFGFRFIF